VDRVKAETLQVQRQRPVFQALSSYLGSTYVNQINKFGRTFQVYVQADAKYRAPSRYRQPVPCAPQDGDGPARHAGPQMPDDRPVADHLYNLYPAATIVGSPAPGFSSGQALGLMDQICQPDAAARHRLANGRRCRIRKKRSATRSITVRPAVLLVYLVLAGQYESWLAPISVVLAVPLALLGPVATLHALRLCQQPLYPDRPDAADRARREERHPDRRGGARATPAANGSRSSRRRCWPPAPVPADPDDVLRLHSRRAAAGAGEPAPAPPRASRSA
jgi:multidrug efflux pump subunit AcrB